MENKNPISLRIKPKFDKVFKTNENKTIIPNINLIYENEFIFLINSLSSSIKEYYIIIQNILKDLKKNAFELNKYILTSKCLINEMNSKTNFQEKFKQFTKNIEGISINDKVINNNILLFEINLNKFFNDSKIIFKKMKDFKKNKIQNLIDINAKNTNTSNTNNTNNSNHHIMLRQKNISQINQYSSNKNNCLKLSLDTNKYNNYSSQAKTNNICSSSRKNWYIKNIKDNTINLSKKNIFKEGRKILNLSENNYLAKKIKNKNIRNNFRMNNSLRNIRYNINRIITNKSNPHFNKNRPLFETSPPKRRMSLSNEKISPHNKNNISYNYNNTNRIKYPSAQTTSRKNNEDKFYYSYRCNNNYLNNLNKKYCYFDSSGSENINNNNILELLENITNYFYCSTRFQNILINNIQYPENINNILLKQKKSLMKINKSLYLYNDFLIINNLKQKILNIININENINQKLIISINYNNTNKKNYTGFKRNDGSIEALKGIFKADYNKIIQKLRNENKNLTIINKKIATQNKLLNQKFNIKGQQDKNKNINITINNLSKENKEYLFQINNLKKDNEELLKLVNSKKNTLNKNNSTNNLLYQGFNDNNYFTDTCNKRNEDNRINNHLVLVENNNKIKKLEKL